ncbi:MAG: FMN-binding negative transcriptional regulator [Acetobacteraceae bacterium]|nr:FMN-binding negative transcriptional regulator [Acetobacteraceae bacterium]
MYAPAHARTTDHAWMREEIARIRFAVLFSAGAGGPIATHLPLVWDGADLVGHVARANPHWKEWLGGGAPSIAVFQGPDAYVSPSLYAAKREHGRVVPTWNYVAVHAAGNAVAVPEPAPLLGIVSLLTDLQERGRAEPWKVGDAPDAFVAAQLKGIVGVRIAAPVLSGTRKLSANRDQADRAGVIAALAEGDDGAREIAHLMREADATAR